MFAAIAPSYDLNNRLHSLWMDQRWRKKAVKLAGVKPTDTIVDVACGTGGHLTYLKHHYVAEGLDLDPNLLAIARVASSSIRSVSPRL